MAYKIPPYENVYKVGWGFTPHLVMKFGLVENEYLNGENETFLDKIKRMLWFKKKESENELLPTIEELISRIVEENRKVGNFFR